MILPQTAAFNSLRTRLQSISAIGLSNSLPPSNYAKSKSAEEYAKELDISSLLREFQNRLSKQNAQASSKSKAETQSK